jgi:ABC-type polysaccharide/polyol phosphate export permease
MYYVVESYREILLEQRLPGLPHLAALALVAVPAFVAGYWFFSRSKHAFVDVL